MAVNLRLSEAEVTPYLSALVELSLPSQPREGRRLGDWLIEAVPAGCKLGAIGWKWFEAGEVDDPATALDIPAFLADPLRRIAGCVDGSQPVVTDWPSVPPAT